MFSVFSSAKTKVKIASVVCCSVRSIICGKSIVKKLNAPGFHSFICTEFYRTALVTVVAV